MSERTRDERLAVLAQHTFKDHEAGDGYTSPSEFWVTCSCGALIWAHSQEHGYDAETDGTPESAKAEHLAAVEILDPAAWGDVR